MVAHDCNQHPEKHRLEDLSLELNLDNLLIYLEPVLLKNKIGQEI